MNITLAPRWASSSLQLSGKAYVDCGTPSVFHNITAFTVEAWVNVSTLTGFQSIAGNVISQGGSGTGQFQLYLYNGLLSATAGLSVSYTTIQAPQPITANTWHHVAATFNGTFSLYVDGNLVAQNTNQGVLAKTGYNLLIGTNMDNGSPNDFFQGQIGRVMVWNTVRDLAGILADSVQISIYNAIENPNLLFCADFSMMPATDISGNNIPLTFNNNAQYFFSVPSVVSGAGGYVNCGSYPNYSIPGNSSYTIEGWFFPTAASNGTLISYGLKGAWEYQVLYQNNQVIGRRNSDLLQIVSTSAVVPLSYYHFALSYDSTTKTLSLYINGNLQSVAYFPTPVTAVPNGTMLLGAQYNSSGAPTAFFNGSIQNIRVWNICLEQAELYQWMYNDIVDDDRLIANYDFSVNPPVDNTDQATITLMGGAVFSAQQLSLAPSNPIAQLGVPQSINAIYLNQYDEVLPPPPDNLGFAPQPVLFSHDHREESWGHFVALMGIAGDESKMARYRSLFETEYEKARQKTLEDPRVLRPFTRTDENGTTRIIYHGKKGDLLVYEGAIGAETDCTLWWIQFAYELTVGFYQAIGLVPKTGDIAKKLAKLIQGNRAVMSAITSLAGQTITVGSAIGVMTVIYKQGLMWPLIKFVFTSAGWWTLVWILTKVIAIVTGLEAAALLAEFTVWAAKLTILSLEYKNDCGKSLPSATS